MEHSLTALLTLVLLVFILDPQVGMNTKAKISLNFLT
jgi:hypothetical protein